MKSQKLVFSAAIMALACFIFIPKLAKADDPTTTPVTINFDVESATSTIFNQPVLVPPCTTPNNASSTVNGFCAFAAAGLTIDATWSTSGVTINSINGTVGAWQWSLNGIPQSSSFDGYIPEPNDNVAWSLPPLPQQQITLTVRDGGNTAFSGTVSLPDQSAPDILVTPTNTTTAISVSPRSVLGILETLEASSSAFNITDLSYYPPSTTFPNGSFLINCIAVPASAPTPDCYNWTDAVDGAYPQIGVDQQQLNNGDVVYLFFGSQQRVSLSTSSVPAGQPFTATAQQYDLASGTYLPLTGVTVGVGTPTSTDPFFIEIATSTVDSNGQAIFTINATGTFAVGLKEFFYFPTAPITITDATSGGGGGGGGTGHLNFNIPSALAFISAAQNSDGSFGSPIVTDWTALAFASENPGQAKAKLQNYLLNETPSLSLLTDYERHAMALEASNINPYSGTPTNYIADITNAFDGTQIGSASEDNDDIFALLVLEHAGFTSADNIIQKDAAFVVSKQNPDGSWDETPDLTAAAIQALGPLFDISGVNGALGQAAGYLASTEHADASWGNPDSTSWVQTSINGIIEAGTPGFTSENAWTSSAGLYPTDAIAAAQQPDGGIQVPANRVWSTSYAVVASSGKSWDTILALFPKPSGTGSGGGSVPVTPTSTATSTLPTLTPVTATSTPEVSTSTIPVIPLIIATNTNPTTTPPVLNKPKPKLHKLVVKPVVENSPAVLGAETTQPANTQPLTPPTPTNNSSKTNILGNIWNAISSFFHNIF